MNRIQNIFKSKDKNVYLVELPNNLKYSALEVVYDISYVSEHFESKAETIWVVTTNLYLDLYNKDFEKIIKQNFRKKKYYTYILPEGSEHFAEKYNKKYSDDEFIGKYNFVFIPKETFDLCEEIVIYDPDDEYNRIGFTLVTIYEEEKLYIKISPKYLSLFIDKLKIYFEDISKLKIIATTFLNYPEIKSKDNLRTEFSRLFISPACIIKEYNEFFHNLINYGISDGLLKEIQMELAPFITHSEKRINLEGENLCLG